jgi:hypothetical protein
MTALAEPATARLSLTVVANEGSSLLAGRRP